MRTQTRYRFALLATLVAAGSVVFAPAAPATDKGSIGTITPEKQHIEATGGPLIGVYPYGASPREAFANYRPPVCRTAPYCDTMEFEVKYPPEMLRERLFGLTITLTWENAYHEETNPSGNDVDLFLWGTDDPTSGGPASKCGGPDDPDCNNIHPEIVTMVEPPDTTAEDAEPAAIWLTIVSEKGINTGYKVTVDWFFFDIEPPPRFTPPDREQSRPFAERVSGPFDFEVTEAQEGGRPTPAATPRKLLVPGPDGKLHEIELPLYAAGQRLGSTADRNTAVPWITAGVAGAIALAVLIFLLVRRNRRAMEEV